MLGQRQVEERLKRALQLSRAAESQVTLVAVEAALTRFANNIIHQNVTETNATVTIKAVVGQATGTAATNDLSDEGLARAAEQALTHARHRPEDPDYPGLPEPKMVRPLAAFDEATARSSPADRAKAVGEICRQAAGQALNASGAFSTTAAEVGVANSLGLLVYHRSTTADLLTTLSGDNGSGRAQASAWEVGKLDAGEIGEEAMDKALRAQNPRPIEPGKYSVVLEPYAVQDIVMLLNYGGMGAQAVQEGRSWMNDRLGQSAMSPLVSIWDDGRDPLTIPLPFDFEGTPRQRVQIVEEGVVAGPVYDRYTAAKEGKESTGHAAPPDMSFVSGPLAFHLMMAPGDSTVEEMIASTERGLYINRFWYTRPVHPRDCVITGMTRDGVWLIEDGEVTVPVKDLRFTQSYVEALANVQAVGRERLTLAGPYGSSVYVPALKIEGFNFTGRTA
jgi:predicted Zn-dependent protease